MSKTITIRVSDEDYKQIVALAKAERRPISNFIMHAVFNSIADLFATGEAETKEILDDKELLADLKEAHKDFKEGRYRIVR